MTQSNHKSNTVLKIGDTSIVITFQDNDHILFVSLGAALAEIQAFEMTIGLLLAVFSKEKGKNEKDVISLTEENFKKTLGFLVKLFTHVVKDEEISTMLRNIKDKRNLLVHRILRKYGWPRMSDDDYIKCYSEINETRNDVYQAEAKLSEYLNSQQFPNSIVVRFDSETGKLYIPGRDDLNDLFDQQDLGELND
jgi:hypothetical protein